MDGIELIQTVAPKRREMKIAIFSGYSEFEYAKIAMQYGVKNYILKPVDPKEFQNTILSMTEELEKEKEDHLQKDKSGISNNAISVLTDGIEVYMPFENLVNIEEEKARLQEEAKKLEAEVARASKMLANKGFVEKAPKAKIEEEEAKLKKYKEMLETVEKRIKEME